MPDTGEWMEAARAFHEAATSCFDPDCHHVSGLARFGAMVAEEARERDALLMERLADRALQGLPDIGLAHNLRENAKAIRFQTDAEIIARVLARLKEEG